LHRARDEPCGKIIVATDEGELGRLQNIYERGQVVAGVGHWLMEEAPETVIPAIADFVD